MRYIVVVFALLSLGILPLAAQDDDIELETFESADKYFTFEYPADWFVNEQAGAVLLTTSDELMDSILENLEVPVPDDDDMILTWLIMPHDFLSLLGIGIESESLDDLTLDFLNFMNTETANNINEPEIIIITSETDEDITYEIGQLTFASSGDRESMVLTYRINEEITSFVIAAAAPASLTQHQTTIYKMLISAEYTGTVDDLIASLSE